MDPRERVVQSKKLLRRLLAEKLVQDVTKHLNDEMLEVQGEIKNTAEKLAKVAIGDYMLSSYSHDLAKLNDKLKFLQQAHETINSPNHDILALLDYLRDEPTKK